MDVVRADSAPEANDSDQDEINRRKHVRSNNGILNFTFTFTCEWESQGALCFNGSIFYLFYNEYSEIEYHLISGLHASLHTAMR